MPMIIIGFFTIWMIRVSTVACFLMVSGLSALFGHCGVGSGGGVGVGTWVGLGGGAWGQRHKCS